MLVILPRFYWGVPVKRGDRIEVEVSALNAKGDGLGYVGAREVLVITPQSPLGTQLQGQQQGDRLELTLAGAKQPIQIVNVY